MHARHPDFPDVVPYRARELALPPDATPRAVAGLPGWVEIVVAPAPAGAGLRTRQ